MRMINYVEEVEVPEGIEIKLDGNIITLKAEKGELSRDFKNPKIDLEIKDNKVLFKVKKASKREKTMVGTFKAHIKNMFKGVREGHFYKLKICSGHFPMNVAINNNKFSVKNFLGEKTPRTVIIREGVDVKIDGEFIEVKSINKELAGQTAANFEQLTRITDRDINKFQDGIYIINKDGKDI
ncbi:MAG: 50S ribosomal protein L6 [Nanoarchaeota archaeon]|nr:50S ribosomal protein L6 [Nanoarchaeota archaeon]